MSYTLGDDYRSGKVETWSYVIGGVFQQFMFVDEFLNGDPRIPYSADITLHYMLHAPQVSSLRPTVRPLPCELDVTAFRDDDLRGSLYLALRVDADSLRSLVGSDSTKQFVARGSYFDLEWNREGAFADTIRAPDLPEREGGAGRALELVRRVDVPFDRYYVACAFEDGGPRARASARSDADVARFAGDRLALSDVLLFDQARAETQPAGPGAGLVEAVERGGWRMRPRIGHRYGPGDRVHAYAEAYNLAAPGGACSYEIRFAIYPSAAGDTSVWDLWRGWLGDLFGTGGEPAVAQTFSRLGNAHTAAERITIDIDALEPGRYELVVEVTDRITGERALSHTPLVKVASRVAGRE
jgi:hypothetical protein